VEVEPLPYEERGELSGYKYSAIEIDAPSTINIEPWQEAYS